MKKWNRAFALLLAAGSLFLSACHQHTWIEADCVSPKTCESCGETEGKPLGHSWQEASCTEPRTCTRCGQTEGEPLGHSFSWNTVEQASCSKAGREEGVCSACGETEYREIEKLPHTPGGDWVVTKEAVGYSEGIQVRYCTVCGEVAEEEAYQLSPEELAAYFEADTTYTAFTYDEVARYPDDHMFEKAKFKGKVIQIMEDEDTMIIRLAVTKERYGWSDPILVRYARTDSSEGRILEDDIITAYGMMMGTYTYTSTMGASITIPYMMCVFVDP